MKPVTEVRQETAEVLGSAVAEVARRAIRPELDPFKQSLESLVGCIEAHAETLDEQVRAEKKALDTVNKQLGEVISAGKGQVAAVAEAQTRVQEFRERLDALASELARTRDEHATTVAALNSLRDEVRGWMRTSNEQAERLNAVLGRTESLAEVLDNQSGAFTAELKVLVEALRSDLTTKIDTGLQQAVERLEHGNRRAVDNIAGLRTTTEAKGAALQTEIGVILEKLTARHEDHGRNLVKTGQTAGRVFRLAMANLFFVLFALAVGGFALWKVAR